MLSQVCFESEPMLRLSSIRRGDLFIIQIIQALKGTFPKLLVYFRRAYDDAIFSNKSDTGGAQPPIAHEETSSEIL